MEPFRTSRTTMILNGSSQLSGNSDSVLQVSLDSSLVESELAYLQRNTDDSSAWLSLIVCYSDFIPTISDFLSLHNHRRLPTMVLRCLLVQTRRHAPALRRESSHRNPSRSVHYHRANLLRRNRSLASPWRRHISC